MNEESALERAIRTRDPGPVLGAPEETDFWDAMHELGILDTFFTYVPNLTIEQVIAFENAKRKNHELQHNRKRQ